MKKKSSFRWIQYGFLAAGFLISAAFYAKSEEGAELLLQKNAHTPAELAAGIAASPAGGTADLSETKDAADPAHSLQTAFLSEEVFLEKLRLIVREELALALAKGNTADIAAVFETADTAAALETSSSGKTETISETAASLPMPEQPDKINLNTATREELLQLKGIGESKADAIIAYRETYGGFGYIEEIMNISGIKEAAFAKIRDNICV